MKVVLKLRADGAGMPIFAHAIKSAEAAAAEALQSVLTRSKKRA